MQYKIEYEQKPNGDDLNFLAEGISHEAIVQRNQHPIESYAFFLRDEAGKILGGISGWLCYGCLCIDMLYVNQEARGKGYGTSLMKEAESLGKSKHCSFARVNTMDWEAKPFYENLGYRVEFEFKGYDCNSTAFFSLKKKKNRMVALKQN